jgi:hypothetical protein
MYDWIEVEQEVPFTEGEYVVKTISFYGKFLKKENVLKVKLIFNSKNEPSWGCTNQIVTHWLKKIS